LAGVDLKRGMAVIFAVVFWKIKRRDARETSLLFIWE